MNVLRPRPPWVSAVLELGRIAWRRRNPAAVLDRQLRDVRNVVEHAAAYVPAYEGVLRPGDADRLQSLDDLRLLPVVDKKHFLALDPERRAWQAGVRPIIASTSGTTGEPFPVPWAPWASWRNSTQRLWMMREMGIGLFDRHVALAVPERAAWTAANRTGIRRLIASRRHALAEDAPADEVAVVVRRLRPDWMSGEPHILAEVGAALDGEVRLRTLMTYGVALDSTLRSLLREAFGADPLDVYGTAECGQLAWQCRAADLYHVNHEIVAMEVVDDDHQPVAPGTAGHLLLTGLINPLLPMIRYRIGDGATFAPRRCACGDPLPALESIGGRTFDWLVDDRGRRVAPQRLWLSSVVPDRLDQVRHYRVMQDRTGAVTIELVPLAGFENGGPADLVRGYQRVLGPGTAVRVREVDAIVVPPGRRFRQFTSELEL